MIASPSLKKYFDRLDQQVRKAYQVAQKAREKGLDPNPTVEIALARELPKKVEMLVADFKPELKGSGLAKAIEELEKEYGKKEKELVALKIIEQIVNEKFCEFKSQEEKAEIALRVAEAYYTLGLTVAQSEGITEVKIRENFDGTKYLSVYYSSPIRAAGGTAAAMSVLFADQIRKLLNLHRYKPTKQEAKRYYVEIQDYFEQVQVKQYRPTEQEIEFIIKRVPIEINGMPTESFKVSKYKDLERVETDRVRGGVVLVMTDALPLKAKKLLSKVKSLIKKGYEFEDWLWLKDYIKLQDKLHAGTEEAKKIKPNYKYLEELVAGRPIFSYPLATGGFRLRYGRTRITGSEAAAIHPATMEILNGFLATGTQIALERPGKAKTITPCEVLEGPIVKLKNGSVIKVDSERKAKRIRKKIEEVLFLGDLLISYGDFVEHKHPLCPAAWCEEWWIKLLKKKIKEYEDLDLNYSELSDELGIPEKKLKPLMEDYFYTKPAITEAIKLSERLGIPLHPEYTYHWESISKEEIEELINWLREATLEKKRIINRAVLPPSPEPKRILEKLGVPHQVKEGKVILKKEEATAVFYTLGLLDGKEPEIKDKGYDDPIKIINSISPVKIMPKAPTYIGARMGRPEKGKLREMTGKPHVLFPVGRGGGRTRSINQALAKGKVKVEVPIYQCPKCGKLTVYRTCERCGSKTFKKKKCKRCKRYVSTETHCGLPTLPYESREIEMNHYMEDAKKRINVKRIPNLIKGVRGTINKERIPEQLAKGILRAKHGLQVFKDGTIRFDMSAEPMTHFRPKEIGTSIEKLKELGYKKDIQGKPLESEDQLLELKPQDIILPACAEKKKFFNEPGSIEVLKQEMKFIDDLLTKFYGLNPYYNLKKKEDLTGKLVINLAPHTSAGTVARIIGFSKTQILFAHPYMLAACRRDADGDEIAFILLMDGLLNFSSQYLPDKLGGSVVEEGKVIAVDKENNVNILHFDELWDSLNGCLVREGKFEKKICNGKWRTYVFDKDYKASLMPIERIIRYNSEGELFKIKTQFGREITITGNHSLFKYDEGIKEVAGSEIKKGDLIIAPRRLPINEETTTIDVTKCLNDPYVLIDDNVEELLKKAWINSSQKSEIHSSLLSYGLSYRLSRKKIPFKTLRKIVECSEELDPSDLKDIKVGLKGSSATIKRFIDLNEDLAWLLGIFTAEGSISSSPIIHNSNLKLLEKVKNKASSCLGYTPKIAEGNKAYLACLPAIFRKVLQKLGFEEKSHDPSKKIIPKQVLYAPRSIIISFLKGFLEGDGNVQKDDNCTNFNFCTTSEDVKEKIIFLLHRLGIIANISCQERKGRKPEFTITVGGGANDNRLERVFQGEEPYAPKSLTVTIPKGLMQIRRMEIPGVKEIIPRYLKRRKRISLQKLKEIVEKLGEREIPRRAKQLLRSIRPLVEGDLAFLRVKEVKKVKYRGYLYDLQVGGRPIFTVNWLYAHNSMDAPLVITSHLDPTSVDDEVYNHDIAWDYPLELYEKSLEYADPREVKVEIIEDRVGKKSQYEGMGFTHPIKDINQGVRMSRYKTLTKMDDKLKKQLALAEKVRAVEASEVARLTIEKHFLRDIKGNLRKFSQQVFRCIDCNKKYRRVPLSGKCTCGGKLVLTVSQGTTEKYLQPSRLLAEKYDVPPYLKQTLTILERRINSLFGKTSRQVTLVSHLN